MKRNEGIFRKLSIWWGLARLAWSQFAAAGLKQYLVGRKQGLLSARPTHEDLLEVLTWDSTPKSSARFVLVVSLEHTPSPLLSPSSRDEDQLQLQLGAQLRQAGSCSINYSQRPAGSEGSTDPQLSSSRGYCLPSLNHCALLLKLSAASQ